MTIQKQILNSHSPSVGRDHGPYSAHYAVNDGYRGWILLLIILVALGGAALVFAQNAAAQTQYHVSTLPSLGGTSSGAFYSTPNNAGYINLGFVWKGGQMRGLPNFPGGNNGFATGANNLGQVVGWAENGVHDPTCCCTQVLQFRPAVWTLGPPDQIHDLPLITGDSSGAATAINDNGQLVGISGICDQAVGRPSANHAE